MVIGDRLAERLDVRPGIDTVTLVSREADASSPVTGLPDVHTVRLPVTGIFDERDVRVRQRVRVHLG